MTHPDGKIVASGDGECVKLWEVLTGKEVQTLTGFKGELSQLLFTRDGRALVSARRKYPEPCCRQSRRMPGWPDSLTGTP